MCGINNAMAFACPSEACTTQVIYAAQGMNCATSSTTCYGDYKVLTCNSCNSNYTRTQQTTSVSGCDNTVTYYTCKSNSIGGGDSGSSCNGTCTDCTSTGWTSAGTGYEQQTNATCNTNTCVCSKNTSYRCAFNYYKTATIMCLFGGSCTGCSPCPTHSASGYTGSSSAGATDATQCSISSFKSWSFSDSKGAGTERFASTCYYSN